MRNGLLFEEYPSIGSLRELRSLEELSLPYSMVAGFKVPDFSPLSEILPFSIRTIEITDDSDDSSEGFPVIDQLRSLMLQDGRYPDLYEMRLKNCKSQVGDLESYRWEVFDGPDRWPIGAGVTLRKRVAA